MELEFSCPPPASRTAAEALARRVETAGMRAVWLYDVPVVWMDPFPLLGAMAAVTDRIHLGPMVSNPVNRPATELGLLASTLQVMSGGRIELALGRGDAAVKRVGRAPASLRDLRTAVEDVYSVTRAGRHHPAWMNQVLPPPLWVGTYGPRGLRLAGEMADGVVLQFADVELVAWAMELIMEGAKNVGRRPNAVRVMVAAAVHVTESQGADARKAWWFADMIAGDVARIVSLPEGQSLSPSLHRWAEDWREAGADQLTLSAPARTELVGRIADQVALIGSASDCWGRLGKLEGMGVETFNIFSLDCERADWVHLRA